MPSETEHKRTLSNLLAARIVPHRFLAAQLRQPSGRFGRWVMTRGLNDGNAELIAATLERLAPAGVERFLDIGFGGGLSLRRASELTRSALWGIDFSADMVAAGQRSLSDLIVAGRLNLITADVAALPLRDGCIDAVCTTNTIYFWPDLRGSLAELRRVVAASGRLAIGYTGRAKMERFNDITQHGFRTYEPDELERELHAAGWTSVRTMPLQGKVTRGDYVTVAARL
jgi:ubiquinone/menaquinone biosynthesis C-methylase UbiE